MAVAVQSQARELATGNVAGVCALNSAALQQSMLVTTFPWFAGSTITVDDTKISLSDPRSPIRVALHVSGTGPRGTGHALFVVVPLNNLWYVDAVAVDPRR